MDIKEMISIMAFYKDGKNIQMRKFGSTDKWVNVHEPSWDWDGYEYRVFIQNIDVKYWEYLKDNCWTMLDRRYAQFEIEELASEVDW